MGKQVILKTINQQNWLFFLKKYFLKTGYFTITMFQTFNGLLGFWLIFSFLVFSDDRWVFLAESFFFIRTRAFLSEKNQAFLVRFGGWCGNCREGQVHKMLVSWVFFAYRKYFPEIPNFSPLKVQFEEVLVHPFLIVKFSL